METDIPTARHLAISESFVLTKQNVFSHFASATTFSS